MLIINGSMFVWLYRLPTYAPSPFLYSLILSDLVSLTLARQSIAIVLSLLPPHICRYLARIVFRYSILLDYC